MGLFFHKLPGSSRVVPSLDASKAPPPEERGIRRHNKISALFLNIFFSDKVVALKEGKKSIYLNKNSLDKWLQDKKENLSEKNLVYSLRIKRLLEGLNASSASKKEKPLTEEQQKLLEEVLGKVSLFKKGRSLELPHLTRKGKTQSETAHLVDLVLEEREGSSHQTASLPGYVGRCHPLTEVRAGGQKIFGGAGLKIHISLDPTIPGNRVKALQALRPILEGPQGVVQYKVFLGSRSADLEKWFGHSKERPGGQQGKEITLYLVDEEQIRKAKKSGVDKETIKEAKKFVKTAEEIAELIQRCLEALEEAEVKGIGYLKNASDCYLNKEGSVGLRDDRAADGSLDPFSHVGQHAYGNYQGGKGGKPQWDDPSEAIRKALEGSPKKGQA